MLLHTQSPDILQQRVAEVLTIAHSNSACPGLDTAHVRISEIQLVLSLRAYILCAYYLRLHWKFHVKSLEQKAWRPRWAVVQVLPTVVVDSYRCHRARTIQVLKKRKKESYQPCTELLQCLHNEHHGLEEQLQFIKHLWLDGLVWKGLRSTQPDPLFVLHVSQLLSVLCMDCSV